MDPHSTSFAALCTLALMLGIKHGFDADHLATIDGLARCNATRSQSAAKLSGMLFSSGHGLVVALVTLAASLAAASWRTPAWLEMTGLTISVAFLFGLAFVNLYAAWRAAPDAIVAPVGFRARWLARFFSARRPWAIAAVGALFALSFDTISQAALFALAAGKHGGAAAAMLLATLFVAGMMAVDGANGLWVARMLRRMDQRAAIASRAMAVTVGALSGAIGIYTVAKRWLPDVEAWADGREFMVGAAVIVVVAVAWACAMLLARGSTSPAAVQSRGIPARG
jgi:high-affinity nickel-transport protein